MSLRAPLIFVCGRRLNLGYLHLFYEDYIAGDGPSTDPYAIITAKKEEIKQNGLAKIKAKAQGSSLIEQEFEKLYSLNDKTDEFANVHVQAGLKEANLILTDFDQAINELKKLAKEGNANVGEAVVLGNQVVRAIDNILAIGAQTGGLGEGAYNQVQSFKQEMSDLMGKLHYVSYKTGGKGSRRQWLIDQLTSIQSNVSGYMLELAWVYAFIGANAKELGLMVNIGSKTGINYKIKNDPRLNSDFERLNGALKSNLVQSKSDAVFNLNIGADGNGSVSATTQWVGFQQKNVADINNIKVGSYTLGQAGILKFYDSDFLVNIVGSLAGDKYRSTKIPVSRRANKSILSTQGEVDKIWANIKNSVKILAIADSIAGGKWDNMTNKVNYYVVRSKTTGDIKVISVSKILRRIANGLISENGSALGVANKEITDVGKNDSRSDFFMINVNAFDPYDNTGQTRSNAAYGPILIKILNTKINISLNFKEFFY